MAWKRREHLWSCDWLTCLHGWSCNSHGCRNACVSEARISGATHQLIVWPHSMEGSDSVIPRNSPTWPIALTGLFARSTYSVVRGLLQAIKVWWAVSRRSTDCNGSLRVVCWPDMQRMQFAVCRSAKHEGQTAIRATKDLACLSVDGKQMKCVWQV